MGSFVPAYGDHQGESEVKKKKKNESGRHAEYE